MESTLIRDHFLDWQCRLRQTAMRQEGGRPSPGIRPRVTRTDGSLIAEAITVLILEKDASETIDRFRHTVRRTNEQRKRYEDGLKMLASEYYERWRSFSGTMTALFASESTTALTLVAEGRCVLSFRQGHKQFEIQCAVEELDAEAPGYQLTYWHNRLFTEDPPVGVTVLAFHPEWDRSRMG
jgi:hypothetical protein